MQALIKLLGAIAFLIASGSVLALERSPFSLITVAEPSDWMLLCGLATMASIARRRRILPQMDLWPSDLARQRRSPNGTEAGHK